MKKQFAYLLCIGILNLLLFFGVFKFFQQEQVFHKTLGAISENYERVGEKDNYEIQKTSKPFLKITNGNFFHWDAAIYQCISERMYTPEKACFGNVRAAFFPLFPLVWKLSCSSSIGISMINYFLFVISIAFLVVVLLKSTIADQLMVYAVLITLPSSIIYYIPYSEALFMFTMIMSITGILKRNYWLFFTGSFLMAMVRPATVFIIIAIVLADCIVYLNNKNFRSLIKEIFFKSMPFVIGYFFAIFIQYLSSGTWTAIFEAHKYWMGGMKLIRGISDWSFIGFGLSSFALLFVCLPAISFLLYLLINRKRKSASNFIQKLKNYDFEYIFLISVFYLIGIVVYTLLTSGGNLHSFFRFILASPPFYIALLFFLNSIYKKPVKMIIVAFILLNVLLILFFNTVEYGGARIQFSYFGLYMFIAASFFLITRKTISRPLQIGITLMIIILQTIWNAYLFNAFLSDGWIFT